MRSLLVPDLYCGVALALALQPAVAFVTPRSTAHFAAGCSQSGARRPPREHRWRPTAPLQLSRSLKCPMRHPCSCSVSLSMRKAPRRGIADRITTLWPQPTKIPSNALRVSNDGVQGDGGEGGKGSDSNGWRQRVVRTILSVFLRVRALTAALRARLGLRPSTEASGASAQSLFRAGGREASRKAAGGGSAALKKVTLLVLMLAFALTAKALSMRAPALTEVPMSTFMQVMDGNRGKAIVDGVKITASGKMYYRMNGKECYTAPLNVSKEVLGILTKSGVPFTASRAPPAAARTISAMFPVLYICAIYYFVFKKGQRDMVGSTGKLASTSELDKSLSFSDVAGVDLAKKQVQELVSMIQNPAPFIAAGARLPSGLLMVGPPGTGKTLMARVMAAEAGVPFYYCSGSDFVEMFVGRGAARVRKLFMKAEKTAPCIVFLDELDALGKERSGIGGGRQTNDEVEQTLNQLLACMDGLDTNNNGVMVIAATNRFEILDDALTRPGRFDRIVRVDVPDASGREAILKVHTRMMRIENPQVLRAVAETTPGLAGAELAAIANEAAISAARRGSQVLREDDFLRSVQNFYESRRKGGGGGLPKMLKGMLS